MHIPPTSPAQSANIKKFEFDHFIFHRPVVTRVFTEIASVYGNQKHNLKQCDTGGDRVCDVLTESGEPIGAVVYKKILSWTTGRQQILEVRNLLLFEDRYYTDRQYEDRLFKRIEEIACKRGALNLEFLVPEKDHRLRDLLKSKNFTIDGEETVSPDKKRVDIWFRKFNLNYELRKNSFYNLSPIMNTNKKASKKKTKTIQNNNINNNNNNNNNNYDELSKQIVKCVKIKKNSEIFTKQELFKEQFRIPSNLSNHLQNYALESLAATEGKQKIVRTQSLSSLTREKKD